MEQQNSMQSSAAANGKSSQDNETTINESYFESLPSGYRFAPTDDELVENYLMKKVNNEPLPPNLICDVNLYSKDPTQLTEEYKPITEKEWYFFTPRDRKYPNGSRPNRATPNGYWKPTGTDKAIPHGCECPVGYKKTLDFYQGKHPGGTKTDWKMHEYIVKDTNNNSQNIVRPRVDMTLDDWVLCKIYKKKEKNGGDEAINNGNNNEFEDQNSNASQPTVNVSQNNGASGNSNIVFGDQNSIAYQPTVNVAQNYEAFCVAGNNEFEFENQNLDASQQTPNQGPMHEVPGTSQAHYMVSQPIYQNQMEDPCDILEYYAPAAFDGYN